VPTVSARRRIDAPIDDVWAVLSDLKNAQRWNSAWENIELEGEGGAGEGAVFVVRSEDGLSNEFQISAWQPPQHVAFTPHGRHPEGGDYWISVEGQDIYLRPAGAEKTEVTVSATARTHGLRGWMVGLLVWPGFQRKGLKGMLDSLADLFKEEREVP